LPAKPPTTLGLVAFGSVRSPGSARA